MPTPRQERRHVMGDILNELQADAHRTSRGPVGCVAKVARDHPDHLADTLQAINSDYPASTVMRVLKRRGVDISDYTVLRHRQSKCRCPEEYR